MQVRDYLDAFAAFRHGAGRDHIGPLAERLRLDLDRTIHELSHGNKQKIGLVQAFMHEPDLLVLDEPTQGLDPLVQQTFYELLDEARARGGTVFLSSPSCRRWNGPAIASGSSVTARCCRSTTSAT
jgi:ABC-2 type transport system ATP-binding protein